MICSKPLEPTGETIQLSNRVLRRKLDFLAVERGKVGIPCKLDLKACKPNRYNVRNGIPILLLKVVGGFAIAPASLQAGDRGGRDDVPKLRVQPGYVDFQVVAGDLHEDMIEKVCRCAVADLSNGSEIDSDIMLPDGHSLTLGIPLILPYLNRKRVDELLWCVALTQIRPQDTQKADVPSQLSPTYNLFHDMCVDGQQVEGGGRKFTVLRVMVVRAVII